MSVRAAHVLVPCARVLARDGCASCCASCWRVVTDQHLVGVVIQQEKIVL